MIEIYDYDTTRFDFVKRLQDIFMVNHLEYIDLDSTDELLDDVKTDQKTKYHKRFYAAFETDYCGIKTLYKEFTSQYVPRQSYYQTIPTFRVHQSDNLAVAAFHRDKDYSHSPKEVNVYLPLTLAYGTNTIWTESEPRKLDYKPIVLRPGQCVFWDGANLEHGNHPNDTGYARVSLDFRFIDFRDYRDEGKTSVTNNTQMKLGEYWSQLHD